jgi:hypothetical protein
MNIKRIDWVEVEKRLPVADEFVYSSLFKLTEIVVNTHYKILSVSDREDLRMTGLIKAIKVFSSGLFDPTKGCLKTFLYTTIRNEVSNYYHKNYCKETFIEEYFDGETPSHPSYSVEASIFKFILESRVSDYTNYIPYIKDHLQKLGLVVSDSKNILSKYSFKPILVKEGVLNRLVCMVIWRIKDLSF